jgi:hypothetical protein
LMWSEVIAAPRRQPSCYWGPNCLQRSPAGSVAHAGQRQTRLRLQLIWDQIVCVAPVEDRLGNQAKPSAVR